MTDATSAPTKPLSLAELRKRRKPLRNVGKEVNEKLSPLTKLAIWITVHVGTMGFFLSILAWTIIWLGWNMFMPRSWRFDPAAGFVLYLFICNVIQILLMPLIMVGQNIQSTHADLRAESDLEVNVKAEKEIEAILEHLEYQNDMLIALVKKLDCDVGHTAGERAAH